MMKIEQGILTPQTIQRGFVALLDVLGFRALVLGDGDEAHLRRYLERLRQALDDETVGPKVDYVVFSDSIVLTTKDDSAESLQLLLLRCSRALGLMLKEEIALRGAIAHGSFFRSGTESGVFVAGRPVIDAYTFEKAQDWVGIMLAPSTIRKVPDLAKRCTIYASHYGTPEGQLIVRNQLPWAAFVQSYDGIPFHGENPSDSAVFSGFAIVPSDGIAEPNALRDSIKGSMEALEWLRSLAPTPWAQAKYKRTWDWLDRIHGLWNGVAVNAARIEDEKVQALRRAQPQVGERP